MPLALEHRPICITSTDPHSLTRSLDRTESYFVVFFCFIYALFIFDSCLHVAVLVSPSFRLIAVARLIRKFEWLWWILWRKISIVLPDINQATCVVFVDDSNEPNKMEWNKKKIENKINIDAALKPIHTSKAEWHTLTYGIDDDGDDKEIVEWRQGETF